MWVEDIWFKKSKIFRDERKLMFDYIPKVLPHRKEEMLKLGEYFKEFILNPGSISVKVILVGGIGTGKTVVAKSFGKKIEEFSRTKSKSEIRYAHVNCHAHRTLFSIMQKISAELRLSIPRRGFSREELIYLLWNYLESSDKYLIATIDEADFLARTSGFEAIYELTRLSEIVNKEKMRISLIFIFRDLSSLLSLEKSAQSTLSHNIIRFEPYTSDQIIDILWARIKEEGAIYEEAINDEVIELIGELVGFDKGGTGDARLAIEILHRAGKYAEFEDREVIIPEDVRKAYNDVIPSFPKEEIKALKLNEKILLLALVRLLQRKKYITKVPLGILEFEYNELCEEYGIKPRRHTTLWEYVQHLKNMDIISAEKSKRGYRGKTTLVGISSVPLQTLEKLLKEEIERDLGVS
ncbi:MAG: ORC1-type DNA replication protein [Thermoproteales archaeon]|nr:ORC1-type DNA replication protein [Thermoproteales archaeon]